MDRRRQRWNVTGTLTASREQNAVRFYLSAKDIVLAGPHAWEVVWQAERLHRPFTESALLREAAWVILCSGMREAVVRKHFRSISKAFGDWRSARAILGDASSCIARAEEVFAHQRKLRAIAAVAGLVASCGFESFSRRVSADPVRSLQELPFIGPVTAQHLAKNLGFDVAKPDRHLVRLAAALGFDAPRTLCECVGASTADPVAVVDVVLWRYLVLHPSGTRSPVRPTALAVSKDRRMRAVS